MWFYFQGAKGNEVQVGIVLTVSQFIWSYNFKLCLFYMCIFVFCLVHICIFICICFSFWWKDVFIFISSYCIIYIAITNTLGLIFVFLQCLYVCVLCFSVCELRVDHSLHKDDGKHKQSSRTELSQSKFQKDSIQKVNSSVFYIFIQTNLVLHGSSQEQWTKCWLILINQNAKKTTTKKFFYNH